jgi:hypothetical protein
LAPFTTAFPGSVTRPFIVPVGTWACAVNVAHTKKIAAVKHRRIELRVIHTLLGFCLAKNQLWRFRVISTESRHAAIMGKY